MGYDLVAFAYATALAAGGLFGLIKKGSMMSGLAGVGTGALMGYGAYQTSQNPNNYYLSLAVSGVMTGLMGSRYV